MATGERIDKVTRHFNEVLMVHPIAAGKRAAWAERTATGAGKTFLRRSY